MAFKRYFTLIVFVAFGILSLAAKREWKADDVPIPFQIGRASCRERV